jgi:hypothetical protein
VRKFKVIENVPIFKYGENANGGIIPESEVSDLRQFGGVVIVDHIDGDLREDFLSRPVGVVLKATRLKYPFVYGRVAIEEGFRAIGFANYEVEIGKIDERRGIYSDLKVLAIELTLVEDKKTCFCRKGRKIVARKKEWNNESIN